MTTEIKLSWQQFHEITGYEIECEIAEVGISLGVVEPFLSRLPGIDVPVCLTFKTTEGAFLGGSAHNSEIEEIPWDTLEKLWQAAGEELDEDEVYLIALNANPGELIDPDNGEPICEDCFSNGIYFEEATPIPIPEGEKAQACWSCRQAIEENRLQREEDNIHPGIEFEVWQSPALGRPKIKISLAQKATLEKAGVWPKDPREEEEYCQLVVDGMNPCYCDESELTFTDEEIQKVVKQNGFTRGII